MSNRPTAKRRVRVVDTDHGTSKSSSFTRSVKDVETGVHFRRVANDEEGAPWEVQVRQLIPAVDGAKVPWALPHGAIEPKHHIVIPRPRRRLVVSAAARTLRHPRPADRSIVGWPAVAALRRQWYSAQAVASAMSASVRRRP